MASFKLVFIYILVNLVHFAATTKAEDLHSIGDGCSGNKTTPNSPFRSNLRTLFNYLSSNATTGKKEFYKTRVIGRNHSDTAYGMFMCRGDIPSQLCGQCVSNATQRYISSSKPGDWDCSLSTEGVTSYDECVIQYSNNATSFSTVDLTPSSSCMTSNVSASFMRLLLDTLNKTADETASSQIDAKKYATKQARISGFQTLYSLAQCTPDLSPHDCRRCLNVMIAAVQQYCIGNEATIYSRSCYIRYALYPFYRPSKGPSPSAALLPASKFSNSQHPGGGYGYLSHNCSTNETVTANGAFMSNLRTLLVSLSSNAFNKNGFYKTTVYSEDPSASVSGLFMCRGDVSLTLCQLCVQNATQRISSECGSSREAIIWYNHCLLRYSYRSSFPTVDETSPSFHEFSIANTSSNPNQVQQSFFALTLANTLSDLETTTGVVGTTKNYGTITAKVNNVQTLYALSQCTPDLSNWECMSCLQNIFLYEIPWCCLASPEGKALRPNCFMMFGLYKFFGDGDDEKEPNSYFIHPQPTTENKKSRSQVILLIVVPTVVVVATLICFGCHLLRRKKMQSYRKAVLKENFGEEGAALLEPLQFDLALIEAATNNFSQENMIGKGGFGEVFKGTLFDGRDIAVKRLSATSKQGIIEFKNEVLLIAKFQHRNLVTFIGFCIKEKGKILIYEYVPNRSLDHFLFDTQQENLLSWSQRYKIIKGIARGVHYLHEHSRPKIIHRDLKPSNVLLDENMNPKLSDFGIARIIEANQEREITKKIAGTIGYMSPEYAMFGHFSEKSDVFSLGVMILEIITGRKNLSSYRPHLVAAGLLTYVWRNWREQTPLSILDPKINENYIEIEITRCIEIGLLCVQEDPNARPPMMTVVAYLDNHSLELPSPQEPAFFMHSSRMNHSIVARESAIGHNSNNYTPSSINEMSISEFLSR